MKTSLLLTLQKHCWGTRGRAAKGTLVFRKEVNMNCRHWAIKSLLRQNLRQQSEINKIRRYLQSQFWWNSNIKSKEMSNIIRCPI